MVVLFALILVVVLMIPELAGFLLIGGGSIGFLLVLLFKRYRIEIRWRR